MKQFLIILLCTAATVVQAQPSSPLSSGKWYKFSVEADGVHKIDYNLLKKAGINPDAINPKNIQLYGGHNGMLPQPNATPRTGFSELAIYVKGSEDGRFNTDDYILFFGQGPDAYQLLPQKGIFQYSNNLYSDKNFYFITVAANEGKRMATIESVAGSFPATTEFDDFAYYESEKTNELHSGRDWFGEQFDTRTENIIRFEVAGILENSPVKLISDVMGQSYDESSFQIFINDVSVGEQKLPKIDNLQYAVKGSERRDTLTTSANVINASARTNQDVKLRFVKASTGRSIGYLDYLLLQTKRKLALYGDQTLFHSLKSLEQPVTRFNISGMTSAATVWDVTDATNTAFQKTTINGDIASFNATSTSLRKYIVVSNKTYVTPVAEIEVLNQELISIPQIDLLIVTAPEFLTEAERLAAHRRSVNLLKVVVATTTQVYNQFSGGKQDVTAIRDYVRYLYTSGSGIKNLLLFGKGSYDYKNYLTYNKNYVPIYESRNSLSPLETYSSDDYFGFLELNEGNWGENPVEDHTLDIGVGRFPVKALEEATQIVDKLIEYDTKNWGEWRKEILFVGDDGDFNLHQDQANQLAESIITNQPDFNPHKLYIDAFKQVNSAIGQVSPEATTELSNNVRKGVVLINYTGHGGEQQWMQERILDQISLEKWTSAPHYPLLVTATCEFGRNDDPGLISTAEISLYKKKSGAIGLLTTARPVNSSTNFFLNKAFYQSLFTKSQNRFRDLGAIMKDTKNNSIEGVANRNFSLLADPSMKLALPSAEIRVSDIKNITSGSDTLKAMSKVRVKGSVYVDNVQVTDYNGTLTTTFYDKPTKEKTKGDENPPYEFQGHDNPVFHGQASIKNGQFEFDFILPSSIDPSVGAGKLSMYASSNSNFYDMTGAKTNVKIGAVEKNPGLDSKGPDIQLFMGDTTFVNGGIAGKNSRIVAILSDENGINISTFIPQNTLTAFVDDTLSVVLSKYYQSDINNPANGKVIYPIDNLKPGQHQLRLRAADTFGNTSTSSISFVVSEDGGIQIEHFLNYPNPVSSSTTFHFQHNRSGEDIEAMITVFDPLGQSLVNSTYQITNSAYQVDLPAWDATSASGTKLGGGLYLVKLSVRSLTDGSKNEKITKFIISN